MVVLISRNARPAAGIQNRETRNPSRKKLKSYPPGPDPKFLAETSERLKILVFFGYFQHFLSLFPRSLGLGPGGSFLSFFRGVSGFRVLDPCSWPGVFAMLISYRLRLSLRGYAECGGQAAGKSAVGSCVKCGNHRCQHLGRDREQAWIASAAHLPRSLKP